MALATHQTSSATALTATGSSRLAEELGSGLKALVDEYCLDDGLVSHYQSQIGHLLDAARCGLPHSPEERALSPQPWGWRPLLESPDIVVGALTVFADHDIPLHDHPGSSGLLLVLNGRVKVTSYKLVGSTDAQAQPPLELEKTSQNVLMPGDQWHFGPRQNNIHALHALDDECKIFDVLFSPYQLQQRSFFMPIVPGTNADNLFVVRLNKLRHTTTSHTGPAN